MPNLPSMNKTPVLRLKKVIFENWLYWNVQVYVFNVYAGCLYIHVKITNLKGVLFVSLFHSAKIAFFVSVNSDLHLLPELWWGFITSLLISRIYTDS